MIGMLWTMGRLLLALLVVATGSLADTSWLSGAAASACTWYDPHLRAEEQSAARALWRANVERPVMIVHPSKAYAGVWLRDSFWTVAAIGDVKLAAAALRWFWSRQHPDGQVPTQFTMFLNGPQYKPDESTLLFFIWAAWQAQRGGGRPPRRVLERALRYITAHAPGGLYQSPAGDYASWFDSFRLNRPDTLAYDQGLYAVALQAARSLGLAVSAAALRRADAGYRALADPRGGYLRFSRRLDYHDVSGLVGEFLSIWLFDRPLLSDALVRRTLARQPAFHGGFRVVVAANGAYLSPEEFTVQAPPGDYQNGGSWLLYDYIGLAVGALHHLAGMAGRMHERLRAEFASGATYHEYLNTNAASPLYGQEPAFRDGFSWDTFVTRVDTVLATRCRGHA